MAKDLLRGRDWRSAQTSGSLLSFEAEAYAVPAIMGDDLRNLPFIARFFEYDEGPEGDVTYTPHQLIFLKRDVERLLAHLDTRSEDTVRLAAGPPGRIQDVPVREVQRWAQRLKAVVETALANEEFLFAIAD